MPNRQYTPRGPRRAYSPRPYTEDDPRPTHGYPMGLSHEPMPPPPPPPPPPRDGFDYGWRWTDLIPLGLVGVAISALMAVLHSCAGA